MMAAAVPDNPPVSAHAAVRWQERAGLDASNPGTAWLEAQRVDAGAPFQSAEVRYHHASQTLLLQVGGVIDTVYDVHELQDEEYHAVKHALPQEARR
ncbi:hypothetical protein [Haloarcula laminariae]|uniref:hypothetical protein n=1 Tax=Haloarcula laminariae TaxID=2961577 RepID=UPI002406F7F9|nr:hypothetical protein [Halomicroarcula sp. FL173]